jgi:hypothetical protein
MLYPPTMSIELIDKDLRVEKNISHPPSANVSVAKNKRNKQKDKMQNL